MKNISKTIYDNGFTQIDSVLAVGDYTAYVEQYNYDADPVIAINVFESIIQDQWRNTNDFLYIQGNHDDVSYPYDEGANEYEDYIVYCVNGNYNDSEMGRFPWRQGNLIGSEKKCTAGR